MQKLDSTSSDISSSNSYTVPKSSSKTLTCYAAFSALFTAFVGLWQYGYAIGSINAVYRPITIAIGDHYEYRYNKTISDDSVEAVWITASAALPAGGMIGSLLVGPVTRKFGRLRAMVFGHVITIIMAALCGLSGVIRSPEALVISRIGIGVTSASVGLGVSTIYIIEVSPKHLRGVFGSMVSIGITFGLMMSNIFGLPEALGNSEYWPILFALAGAPSVLFVLMSGFLSESPRKLYLEDNNLKQTRKVLRRLVGEEGVAEVLEELDQEKKASGSSQQMTVFELLKSSKMRKATIVACVVSGAQQVTGLNAVSFNMNNIYRAAGIEDHLVYYVSIGVIGGVFTLQLFMARLTDLYGRKKLLVIGYSVEAISLFLINVSIETQQYAPIMAYVAVVASLGFWIGFSIGPGPCTMPIVAEFFDQRARSAAVVLSSFVLWFMFILIVVSFPYVLASIRGYAFSPFVICAVASAILIGLYVPETKNRPFSDIQNSFQASSKGSADEEKVDDSEC